MNYFIIKFRDGDNVHSHRHENYDSEGDIEGYGDVMRFETREKAEAFLKELDEREFDRWVEGEEQ